MFTDDAAEHESLDTFDQRHAGVTEQQGPNVLTSL